jgi:hypothetical protein
LSVVAVVVVRDFLAAAAAVVDLKRGRVLP